MGGLTTSLLTGLQALETSQAALDATSNNIANANTAGYTREVPATSENQESLSGGTVTGGGVTLEGLQSVRDELLNMQIQQQTSQQSSASTESSLLTQLQTVFTSNGEDLATTLSSFSASLAQLSASPGVAAVQQAVVNSGQNLARSFNSIANALSATQTSADQQVTSAVSQVNALSAQIAQLNAQLTPTVIASQNGGTIEDQRDQLVQQLSQLTGITVSQSSEGEVITTGNGSPLVMGGQSYSLQTTTGSNGFQQVLDSNGNNITASIQGGQLGGALQMRDQVVPGYLNSINTLATQFGNAFNAAQEAGYDSTGNAGQAFFTVPSASAAAGISVAITSGSQVAASSDGSSGSGGNVANLSAALTNALPSGQTATNAYSNLVYQVGSDTSNASDQSSAISQSLLQLTDQQSSVSGVSIDEETTNLIRYQTAYEAAARVISTIQALSTVTLDMGSAQSY